jgi:hypothetical protein
MIIINESFIRADKENREREIAAQIRRRDQIKEARSFKAKNKASKAGLLKAASRKASQLSLPRYERQSKLAGQES